MYLDFSRNGSLLDRQRTKDYMDSLQSSIANFPSCRHYKRAIHHWFSPQWNNYLFYSPAPYWKDLLLITQMQRHTRMALIPTLKLSFAQAVHVPDEINRAEAMAKWANAEFLDCHCTVYCDNAAIVATLTKGTGHLWSSQIASKHPSRPEGQHFLHKACTVFQ